MRGTVHGRLFPLLGFAVCATLATSMSTEAAAFVVQRTPTVVPAGDHNHNGNGRGNVNTITIRSPAKNHGVQTVADSNAKTLISRNNAVCTKRRSCRIHQRASIIVH